MIVWRASVKQTNYSYNENIVYVTCEIVEYTTRNVAKQFMFVCVCKADFMFVYLKIVQYYLPPSIKQSKFKSTVKWPDVA